MGQYADMLAVSAKRTRGYAEKLLQGIEPSMAARKPKGEGNRTIDANHPAFVFGHLGLYPARVVQMLGENSDALKAPEAWEALFKAGAPCLDDGEAKAYPPLPALAEQFFRATDGAIAVLERLPDERLLAPMPDERWRASFPTVGSMALFLLNNHAMMHLGQVSTWRRCMGLPGVM